MKKLFLTAFVLLGLVLVSQAQTKHSTGEKFDGGIVFDVSADSLHGLIAETVDQGHCKWLETADIVKNGTHSPNGKAFTDWRLPTKDEWTKLLAMKDIVGGFNYKASYWSSTESGKSFVWCLGFTYYNMYKGDKRQAVDVRAVRDF